MKISIVQVDESVIVANYYVCLLFRQNVLNSFNGI